MQRNRRPENFAAFCLVHLFLLLGCGLPSAAQGTAVVSALSVPLVLPAAVAIAPDGSVFVAERGAHLIRRIDPTGTLTLVAGNGIQGFSGDGDLATRASLDSPQGLAFNARGILYIADTHNHRIRAVDTATGIISTIAGTGLRGLSGDGEPAASAELASPSALALGPDGTLYLADTGNHRIRSISPAGIISSIAGTTQGMSANGTSATSSALDSPSGLAVDTTGNLYIADTHNHRIVKLDISTGMLHNLAGDGTPGFSGDGAPATLAHFALPMGISLSGTGDLYIADSANQRLRKIASDGTISSIAGNGIQGLSGDGGDGSSATLDRPSGTAFSSTGITFFTDTGNQRVRQLSSADSLQTVAGLGTALSGTLTLSAPSVLYYGSGSILASLQSSQPPAGVVTFLSFGTGSTSTLGTAAFSSNQATLSLGNLNAGSYNIFATYSGDSVHAPAQSSVFPFKIAPLSVTAVPNPVALLYGQSIPPLTGALNGVLPRDQQSVAVQFVSEAGPMSPTGSYPITAVLAGKAASNYALTSMAAAVSIAQAPTLSRLTITGSPAQPGLPITLTAQITSSTSGTPSGAVSLLDGATVLAIQPLSATGLTVLTTTSFAAGVHNLSAAYSGDINFLPSASAAASLIIGSVTGSTSSADFSLATVGPSSQIVTAGTTAQYNFSVQPQGTLASPITLEVSGLPAGASASFSPVYLPPGVTAFTLTVAAPKAILARSMRPPLGRSSTLFALLLLPFPFLRRRASGDGLLARVGLLAAFIFLAGCGDRIYSPGKGASTSKSYTLTINASATTPSGAVLLHSATVTLVVQ